MSLDPQVQGLLDAFKAQGLKSFEQMTVPESRETAMAFVGLEGDEEAVADVSNHRVPVKGGDIAVRIYRPAGAAPHPMLVYFHGGGFVFGNLDLVDKVARSLCNAANAAVVSVDYRKAPEHPYPTAPEDAYAGLVWARENAAKLGLDPARIAVAGDSAGGNLAAVVAIAARESADLPLVFQLLIYPATDMRRGHPSHQANGQGYLLTRDTMTYFHDHYITDAKHDLDWRASPLLHGDLSRLPPALVLTAGYDPLRDEGLAYAEALTAAGNSANYVCFERQIHGFVTMGKVLDEANTAVALCATELRRAFAAPRPQA